MSSSFFAFWLVLIFVSFKCLFFSEPSLTTTYRRRAPCILCWGNCNCSTLCNFFCQTCSALLMAPSTYSQLLGDRKQWRTLLIRDGRLEFQSCSSKFYKKDQEISMRLEVNLLPCSAPTGTTRCGTSPTCWSTLTGRFSGFRRRFIRFCSSI